MRRILFAFLLVFAGASVVSGQTVIWSEDFNNGCAANCPGGGYVGPNGAWTENTTLGFNGAEASEWYVSGAECGNAANTCGTGCGTTDASLHVGSSQFWVGDIGAAYEIGGFCGLIICVEAHKRMESPVIDLTGQSNITLQFNYIEFGEGADDDASLYYFDGATWSLLDPLAKTMCCNAGGTPVACNGAQQGYWTNFSIALPASANNNPNVQIGFFWQNDDDGVGGDPTFAVDDIELTIPSVPGPPEADFTVSSTTICEGDCIDFTDASTSTAGGITTWDWDFGGGATNSTLQNPTNICFNTPGTYTVTLTVTDPNGTDDSVATNLITVDALPDATISGTSSFCDTDGPSTLTAATGGGTWSATCGACLSGTGVFDPATAGVGSHTITYDVTSGACTAQGTFNITVNNCGQPTASFTASATSICEGESITFTDASTGTNINAWTWNFAGGTPATANTQGPHTVTFNTAGTYTVDLTITDANGTDDTVATNLIVVNPPPTVTANATVTTICNGDPVTLTGSGADAYAWDNGVTDGIAFNPTSTTTYTVTGTDVNGCTATDQVTVTVDNCQQPISDFSFSGPVCEGSCITFTDLSTDATSWEWTFGGGTPATSTAQDPGTICFAAAGTYDVELIVSNSVGSDTTVQSITVIVGPTVDAGPDQVINAGESTTITATGSGAGTYVWSPATGLGNPISPTTTASPTVPTTYTVTFTDGNGCIATDDVLIDLTFNEAVGLPDAFSPNGDGFNDEFRVRGSGFASLHLVVYNRYGQVVFETMDQTVGWDGTHNGSDVNPGVFTYVFEYTFVSASEPTVITGNVTLLR